jgi:hypothetical protein
LNVSLTSLTDGREVAERKIKSFFLLALWIFHRRVCVISEEDFFVSIVSVHKKVLEKQKRDLLVIK